MDGPRRIVSLVPSLTELLFSLGAGDRVAGRTRFCVEPPDGVRSVPIVGGTKNPGVDRIAALAPDLVIANREENRREDVEALQQRGLDVLVTDPVDVEGALAMILDIGRLVGGPERAASLAAEARRALAESEGRALRPVCVLLWKDPWMALGSGTYGHDLLERCGGRNVFGSLGRYPEVTLETVRDAGPELVLLPDEPYPFTPRHAETLAGVGPARVIDGRDLWWYGPRMPAAIRTLSALIAELPD